jgi:hypothetical protein
VIPAALRHLAEPVTRRIAATYHVAEHATDLARHLIELEVRLAESELWRHDFDRDLGCVEAVVAEHYMGALTPARKGAR